MGDASGLESELQIDKPMTWGGGVTGLFTPTAGCRTAFSLCLKTVQWEFLPLPVIGRVDVTHFHSRRGHKAFAVHLFPP